MTKNATTIFVPMYAVGDIRDITMGFSAIGLHAVFYHEVFTDEDIAHLTTEDEIAAAQIEKAKAGIIRFGILAMPDKLAALKPADDLIRYCIEKDYPVFIFNANFECTRPGLWPAEKYEKR